MRARVKTSIIIDANVSAVFKYLADLKLHYVWNPHLRELKPLKKLHESMMYETSTVLFGVRVRANNEVTKFVPDAEVEIRNQTGVLRYRVNYQVEPVNKSQTELRCTTVVEIMGKAFYFTRPMMEQLARRELNTDLAALKAAVEQQLT